MAESFDNQNSLQTEQIFVLTEFTEFNFVNSVNSVKKLALVGLNGAKPHYND